VTPSGGVTARTSVREDAAWVLGFGLLVLASRVVELRGPRREIAVGGRRMPPLCAFRLVTGHRCPGCGMTRAFLYLFRFDLANAVRANLMSPFVFVLVARTVAGAAVRLVAGEPTRSAVAAPPR